MTAIDAFLWTVTVWLWVLLGLVGWAVGITIRDEAKRRIKERRERVQERRTSAAVLTMHQGGRDREPA